MYGIFLSAINAALVWLVRSVLVKFFIFFALYFVTTEFIGVVLELLPDGSAINSSLSGIGSGTWFFLETFAVDTGLAAVVSAYTTRFIIRRIPVIG